MTKSKDAAAIKALEELGLRNHSNSSLSSDIEDLRRQLDAYEQEIGSLDPDTLAKYLIKSPTLDNN